MGGISVNHISDKCQYPKYIKKLYNPVSIKQSDFKMHRGSEKTFFKRRHTDGQWIHEKVHNITNQQGNAYENHSEISPHMC